MITSRELHLTINEIFYSIQGESTFAGLPCVFVRLTGCDLRCTYCDTAYAFYEGKKQSLESILTMVKQYNCPVVEITGGEPLLQKNVHPLMTALCDLGYTVLLETSGAHDLSSVDSRVHRIMDWKCPDSHESQRNYRPNLSLLGKKDEVKFVIGSQSDYDWAKEECHGEWTKKVHCILFSPVFGKTTPLDLATWILQDRLPVRMQIQMHKLIWDPQTRGV